MMLYEGCANLFRVSHVFSVIFVMGFRLGLLHMGFKAFSR